MLLGNEFSAVQVAHDAVGNRPPSSRRYAPIRVLCRVGESIILDAVSRRKKLIRPRAVALVESSVCLADIEIGRVLANEHSLQQSFPPRARPKMVRLAAHQTRDSVSTTGPQCLHATFHHPTVDDHSIESVAANAFEQLWCIAPCIGRNRWRLGHIVQNLILVTFQKRNIPIERHAKPIALCPGIGNVAEQDGQIDIRPIRQFLKDRDLVLNGMTGDECDSVGH